ncbi:hypothetical protein F5887DRAFT_1284148 [Amanita rubescens]|nr:hypothetical protein F5887DRAFT_1284148 [Amanita rubescens]
MKAVDDEYGSVPLNNMSDLGKGIIKTSGREYTILLIGETGKGKTTFLSLLANILNGKNPQNYESFYDQSNEAGGNVNQSQTNSARLYKLTSRNGIVVRVLDTPGLADTRGLERDDQHKASIARAIEETIPIVNAVIIIANGTEERLGAATDYALTMLSSIFPNTLANNIGILFTNVASRICLNFQQNSLPPALRPEPGSDIKNQFLLDNPLALWKKLSRTRDQSSMSRRDLEEYEDAVNASHTKALRELVHLFNWLDTRIPQPTNEIISLQKKSQEIEDRIDNAILQAENLSETKEELKKVKNSNKGNEMKIDEYEDLMRQTRLVWEKVPSDLLNSICSYPGCYTNCKIGLAKRKHWGIRIASAVLTSPLLHVHPLGYIAVNRAVGTVASRYSTPRPSNSCHCGHTAENHTICESVWEKRETNLVLDPDAQMQYDQAKSGHDDNRTIVINLDYAIMRLDQKIKKEFAKIVQLVRSYASLSLAGSIAGPKQKAIRLLETRLESLRNKNSDPSLIDETERSLEMMKERLKAMEEAEERAEIRIGGSG